MRKVNLFIKRLADIFGSICGIIVFSPLLLIISLLIKITSPGPVFFLQERLGKNGRPFRIIKFRTMVVNAEKIGDGLSVRSDYDPRITKIGHWLRKSSLDEIPQIFNVLTGKMSFVGPRPPVAYHPYDGYEKYPEWAKKRFEMRPGMTGLSQVTVRNSVSWDERIKIDNTYIEQFNILLDIKILVSTVASVFSAKDIYAKGEEVDALINEREAVRK